MSGPGQSRVKTWIGTGLAVVFIAGFVYMVANAIMAPAPTQQKRIQQIMLVMPPPPPPPVEQPPEPEIEEQVETPPEQPVEADAPPAQDLGVDSDAAGSGDGFGLVARKGGRDLLDGGPFGSYKGLLAADIKAALDADRRVRAQSYNLTLELWIGRDGRIERVELGGTTGDRAVDKNLRQALADIGRVREAPPLEMPQPVRLRVTSRL
jgi:protein TonB